MISLLAVLSHAIVRTALISMSEPIMSFCTSEVDSRGYAQGWDGKRACNFYELDFDHQKWLNPRTVAVDFRRGGFPQLFGPRYAAISQRGVKPEPYASSWFIDLATGKELAHRSSELNMGPTSYVYNEIEFPTKLLPRLQFRLPDGGVVELLTDTAKAREGILEGKPISYRPGTWDPIAEQENRQAVAYVQWVEHMGYEGPPAIYHWTSWDGKPLPFGSEHVEAHGGRYYVQTYKPEPGQKLSVSVIECTDDTGKRVLWRVPYASFISLHSFVDGVILAAWGHDPTKPEALILLDPKTGKALAKAPLAVESRICLLQDHDVFVLGAKPNRVERWTVR